MAGKRARERLTSTSTSTSTFTSLGVSSQNGAKKKRGRTRNLKLLELKPGEKLPLEWDSRDRPIGDNAATFANHCGACARNMINLPLKVKHWGEVSKENKQRTLANVMEYFEFELTEKREKYIMDAVSKKFKEHRQEIRDSYYYTWDKDEDRLNNPPPKVPKEDWEWLVHYWGTAEFQKLSKTNLENRKKQDMGHCTGSKSFACVMAEAAKAKGREPSRVEMFALTHTHENDGTAVDGTAVDERSKNVMEKFKAISTQQEELSDNERLNEEEIYYEVMPKERPGRVRGMGCNVTYSQMYGRSKDKNAQNEKKVQGLETQMTEQNERIQKMVEEKEQMQKELEQQKEQMDNMNGQVGFLYSFIQTMCPNFRIPPNGASDSSAGSVPPSFGSIQRPP